ncbi:MAG: methionyl-tRNA formyltransferase [Lentisphaerae bacterium]|nr:methionyl-tRNA formyltransferase [Lentisphaerota bacterium]
MRIVFMGSADVSSVVLRALVTAPTLQVVGVVTQPDRPAGRQRRLAPCDGKREAELHGLPVLTPEKLNRPEVIEQLVTWAPDVIVVVAYGQFLGARILALPPLGCINVHLSLLPLLRGAAPVHRAIAAGHDLTGVTIMQMDKGMDSGDILLQQTEPIFFDDTAGTLHDRLSALGAQLILQALPALAAGQLVPRQQNELRVTFAPKLTKEEGHIDWTLPACELALRIRAFNPWPACHTWLTILRHGRPQQERLKILQADAEPVPPGATPGEPGQLIHLAPLGPAIATGDGWLRLRAVQRAGGRVIDGAAFICGFPLTVGQRIQDAPAIP